VANSIWGQAGYGFLAQYLDTLAESYGAGLRLLDFESGPDAGRRVINQWVLDQTEGRIEDLLPEGSILTTTRLVLTNAIYFKASWLVPFDERNTQPGPFHREDGSQVTVDLMQESATYGVSTGPGYSAVEMLYLGEQLSMVVIVPEGQTLAELEADLTPPALQSILDSLQLFYIHLVFPKFTFEFELPLVPVLQALGMTTAFQWPGADFSGIDGTRDLYVQEVRHKAFVGVDEAGTEAAAATAVVVGIVSVPPEVRVDRPFIFLIRDIPTGAILFLGRVVDPAP
ncbi:MAG: serpin family protein, partial [Planctomycetes bacterium]|nr:serpin family protein [Planctomycetota bacterium]